MKSKILSNLFNEMYGSKLGEFNNTTGNERVKKRIQKFNGEASCQIIRAVLKFLFYSKN